MSKLHDMIAFGESQDDTNTRERTVDLRILRAAMRWMLAVSLLGVAFSGGTAYGEYASTLELVRVAEPSASLQGSSRCIFGVAVYAVLTVIAAVALWRTRGDVGDEVVSAPR